MDYDEPSGTLIIPQQETSGNYNLGGSSLTLGLLYHNKKHQGTTTANMVKNHKLALYHNKKHQGTTTYDGKYQHSQELYHNKKHQGTTTR